MNSIEKVSESGLVHHLISPAEYQLIEMWIHDKAIHTQRYYRRHAIEFLLWIQKPIDSVTLKDLQDWVSSLAEGELEKSSQAQTIESIKSLFSFAYKDMKVLAANPAAFIKPPKSKDCLAERILPEDDVRLMIRLETNQRNQTLLRLLYLTGMRVSEICGLTWRDFQPRDRAGQVTILGKGEKTRAVILEEAIWQEVMKLRHDAIIDAPVFSSRKGKGHGHLTPKQVGRIVKAAAARVPGMEPTIAENVSPHWLRHAHGSHAMDGGAPIHLVQATLGHANVATTSRYLHVRPTDSSSRFLKA